MNDEELSKRSAEAHTRIEQTEDFHEGPLAFIQMRPADWKGR